ncbi:hypothetical protein HDK90DRAFT_506083 [Phyllosticta capitalensis]|uniref:F-box domain-containing protein n=1 Tax=Phyllosticta capitalensis TaxID=121624 RepID=A0ABR1Z1L6_9PEZI
MAYFHKLPAELKLATVGFLSDEDLLAFRRANREFNHLSFDVFGKRFFSRRTVALHLADLQCFVQVAEAMGKYVKTLSVIPQTLDDSHLDSIDEEIDYWKEDRITPYLDGGDDWQWVLRKQESRGGLASSLLARAVSRLANLKAVSFDTSLYISKLWKKSKVAKLDDEFADDVDCEFLDTFEPHFHTPDFEIFMTAMIASGAAPSTLVLDDDFIIEESSPSKDGPEALDVRNFLKNLKELEFGLVVEEFSDIDYVPWFLAAVPKTLELLIIREHHQYVNGEPLLEHLGQSNAIFQSTFAACQFRSLRHLEAEFPPCVFPDLVQLVRDNLSTLTYVELYCEAGLDWDLARRTKWSVILRLFLKGLDFQRLALDTNSETYPTRDSFVFGFPSFPTRNSGLNLISELNLQSSAPETPWRPRLLETVEGWEKHERDAGL